MPSHSYFIYITTNPAKTVLYIGVTNDLRRRIQQHFEARGSKKSFTGKYYCYNLIYYERFQFIQHAIQREKELKKWRRSKKEELISSLNPDWKTLNLSELCWLCHVDGRIHLSPWMVLVLFKVRLLLSSKWHCEKWYQCHGNGMRHLPISVNGQSF